MNKQELIDNAVHTLGGAWPSKHESCKHLLDVTSKDIWHCSSCSFGSICNKEEFQQRARELGYINGYRWGVEYQTNGDMPDLPDDVEINCYHDKEWHSTKVHNIYWGSDCCFSSVVTKFKITDERYKPAGTSYLPVSEIPESKSNAENVSDWYDYEAQKAVALPPVGDRVSYSCIVPDSHEAIKPNKWYCGTVIAYHCGYVWTSDNGIRSLNNTIFRPLDHDNRKAEAEKKRVVDAAVKLLEVNHGSPWSLYVKYAESLYDAGFLRMPAE